MDECNALIGAIHEMLVAETAALVRSGSTLLALQEAGAELRPSADGPCAVMIYVQGAYEISFFPTAPGTDRTPTIDIFNKDAAALVGEARQYVDAFLAGRVELTLKKDSSSGPVRLWLSDGRERTHLYNVIFGFRVGHGAAWDTFLPTPY